MSAHDKTGGPAFPLVRTESDGRNDCLYTGMSLRDWYAGMALQAEITSKWYQERSEAETWLNCAKDLAKDCYTIADAMLAERVK